MVLSVGGDVPPPGRHTGSPPSSCLAKQGVVKADLLPFYRLWVRSYGVL